MIDYVIFIGIIYIFFVILIIVIRTRRTKFYLEEEIVVRGWEREWMRWFQCPGPGKSALSLPPPPIFPLPLHFFVSTSNVLGFEVRFCARAFPSEFLRRPKRSTVRAYGRCSVCPSLSAKCLSVSPLSYGQLILIRIVCSSCSLIFPLYSDTLTVERT